MFTLKFIRLEYVQMKKPRKPRNSHARADTFQGAYVCISPALPHLVRNKLCMSYTMFISTNSISQSQICVVRYLVSSVSHFRRTLRRITKAIDMKSCTVTVSVVSLISHHTFRGKSPHNRHKKGLSSAPQARRCGNQYASLKLPYLITEIVLFWQLECTTRRFLKQVRAELNLNLNLNLMVSVSKAGTCGKLAILHPPMCAPTRPAAHNLTTCVSGCR